MIIFPAIDIKEGKCVRLLKGDFNKVTQYKKSPTDQAVEFSDMGFKNIHLVDLDGALKGNPINENIIKEISKINTIKIQVGGGIRSVEHIKKLIDLGVDKVIIGTAAVENIAFLKAASSKFAKKIAVSLDVRDGFIALSGWKNQTKILASDSSALYPRNSVGPILSRTSNQILSSKLEPEPTHPARASSF